MHETNAFWWDNPIEEDLLKSRVHLDLFDHVRAVEERQHSIHRLNLFCAKLYTNRQLACLTWGTHSEEEGSYGPLSMRTENLIANAVDTATALIGRQRPKATPVAKDADFCIEQLAKRLDQWLYAEFKKQDVYTKMQRAFNDACWAQVAALYVGVDGDEIYTERVMPDELVVDQRECAGNSEPIQIHRRRLMSKVVLEALYPDFKPEIRDAGKSEYTSYRKPGHEMIVVIESWKLSLGGEDKGRHSVVIEGATLFDEEYDRDCFPFVFLRWHRLPTGFYGRSLVEEGAPFQLRHNELNRVIQLSQDLMCVPRIFVEGGSSIVKSQFDDEVGRVLHYRGKVPEAMTWQGASAELYNQREANKVALFESIGISRMSAQAKVPDGVRFDSSKALREANFKENERFQVQAAMLEDAYMEVAKHFLYHGKKLYTGRKPSKSWQERSLLDEIDWEKLGEPGQMYELQLEASSLNNMTPAARKEQLDEWANNGLITPDEYKGLLGHPDMEEAISLFSASVDDIKKTDQLIAEGKRPQPDPLQNLTFGIPYIHKTYLKRKSQVNVPEEVLEDYRHWIVEAQAIMEGEQQAQTNMDEMAMQAEQAAMAAQNLQAPVGEAGTPLPAVATTAQGTPAATLV
jgi:hypothetical protein